MALWTPADRLTNPKLWIRARSGTYSGSALTAITNDGTGGSGSPTISGTVVKGATMNGKDTLRLEGGNTIGIPMNAWGSGGKLFAITVYKSLYSSGERAFFQASPAWGSTGALGVYAADNAGDFWSAADGYNGYGGGGGSGPYWYGGAGPPRQTLLMQSWFFGPSNTKTRVNAVDQTPTFTVNGSVPNYAAGTWRLGEVTGGEPAESDFPDWVAFDDIPPDLAEWEGWFSWEYAGDGSLLPVGHPYKNAPPTTDDVTGTGAATLALIAAASGTAFVNITGAGAASLVMTATASGAVGAAGTASATLALGAAGSGTVGQVTGTGAAVLRLLANAVGNAAVVGPGATTLTLTASATGFVAGSIDYVISIDQMKNVELERTRLNEIFADINGRLEAGGL